MTGYYIPIWEYVKNFLRRPPAATYSFLPCCHRAQSAGLNRDGVQRLPERP